MNLERKSRRRKEGRKEGREGGREGEEVRHWKEMGIINGRTVYRRM